MTDRGALVTDLMSGDGPDATHANGWVRNLTWRECGCGQCRDRKDRYEADRKVGNQ